MSSVCIWEWIVDDGADRAPYGVSMSRHRAMTALSQTLIAAGSASGCVVPMTLVDGAYGVSYLRVAPGLSAKYEKRVIKWR